MRGGRNAPPAPRVRTGVAGVVFRPGIRHVEYRPREWSYEAPGRTGPSAGDADDPATVAGLPADEAAVAGGATTTRSTDPAQPAQPAGSPGPAGRSALWPGQV